jgi:hypothetical protein
MIFPIHIEQFLATAKGREFKFVGCENCRIEYVYLLARVAEGTANTVMFIERAETQELAISRADAELRRSLSLGQDPVPCPSCGWYQQSMVPLVRAAYMAWMRFVGILILYLAVLVIAIAAFAFLDAWLRDDASSRGWSLLWDAACLGYVGVALIAVRKYLATWVQPNESDTEKRKDLGRRLARTREEFDRLLAAANRSGDG